MLISFLFVFVHSENVDQTPWIVTLGSFWLAQQSFSLLKPTLLERE
jgi:hypothetical protein